MSDVIKSLLSLTESGYYVLTLNNGSHNLGKVSEEVIKQKLAEIEAADKLESDDAQDGRDAV